jgi:ribonuclease BN (tRNA processing enzyme)
VRLTILGSSASFPAAGDACSGYLVEQGSTRLLLDCGSGTLARLLAECRLADLSAILITHFHPDHYLDLVPMRYGLRYGIERVAPPRLILPPGGKAFLERLGAAIRNLPEMFNEAFAIEEYHSGRTVHVGDFELRFQRTTHDDPTWAVAVQGDARLVYTADTQESRELESFALGAHLLLCEATYPHSDSLPTRNHLTSLQAGRLARAAGVHQLALTHFWPGIERGSFEAEAAQSFGRPVMLAEPGMRLEVVNAPELERTGLAGSSNPDRPAVAISRRMA